MRRFIGLVAVLGMILMVQEAQAEPFAKPDLIRFGASTADMQAALQGKCAKSVLRDIVPPSCRGSKTGKCRLTVTAFRSWENRAGPNS